MGSSVAWTWLRKYQRLEEMSTKISKTEMEKEKRQEKATPREHNI